MTLAEKLSTYDEKYWDFSEYRNDAPLVRYPAVMVAPMQACILKEIINADPTTSTVLDPFCGSGTVLCEGQKLGLNVMGFDINPMAVLIATVQLEGIPEDCAVRSINAINTRLTMLNGNVKSYAFKNINKWFNDDIIVSLSVIRQAIIEETNERMRRFFWCCFAETVKKFSNTRTSTFKLHIKEQSKIEATVDDTITFFKEHIQNNYLKYVKDSTSSICIKCGDSKEHLAAMVADSVDLICTSPPYGDNHTTVTYGQFSILPLLWIDKKDLHIWDDTILETFTAIDSASLGGRVKRKPVTAHPYSEFVGAISLEKQKKVIAFLEDYEKIFSLLARVLKPGKLLVLTLGNRRVDNKEIAFDVFNDVLYTAYRENLKIREDTLYSMLRSRLEQQLADATFEGEDIDEDELRDISGRARFLIRKLCGKGWFEKERGDDFEEYITVPSYSSRLLELFHQLRDDRPARGFSYVFGTYSALKVANESESVYDKMAAIYSAYDNTSALINLLQMVYHNVKHYFQMQIDMQDVNQVLASHFNEFGQKVVEAYIRPLKIKDSVPKYRVPIQSVLRSWAEDDALLLAMANAALQDKRGDTVENCRSDLLQKIFWIDERYDNIEHDYLDEIDAQVRRYTRAATQKVENLTNRDQNVRGNLNVWRYNRAGDVFELIRETYLRRGLDVHLPLKCGSWAQL